MNPANNYRQQFGGGGVKVITGTSAHAGPFSSIQFLEDSVVAAADTELLDGDIATLVFPAGVILYLPCRSITLTSGSAVAYKSTVDLID